MRAKVVHIITRLELGGAQQNTLYTAGHLDRERFEPVLLAGEGGLLDPEARELESRGLLRLRFFPDLAREISPLRDLSALLQLRSWLADERPEIVHTHSSKAGILGRLAARLAGVPIVLHSFHGFAFHDRMPAAARTLYVALERAAAAWSTRLVFVSRANLEYAARLGLCDPGRAVLIRSGVRLGDFPAPLPSREAKKASLGCRRHHPLVVSVGNLKPQKNALDFVRLAKRVLQEAPDVRFYFVGDGPLRPRMEAAILKEGLYGKLLLGGWRRDVAEILAAADVFVLTSLWEGLPRALVEAMKSGLPCAAYATDGVRDLLRDGENGFTAEPGVWETLARRVLDLLADEGLRRRLGAAAQAAIGPEFDIDEMVRRQESLYDSLLAAWRGPEPWPFRCVRPV